MFLYEIWSYFVILAEKIGHFFVNDSRGDDKVDYMIIITILLSVCLLLQYNKMFRFFSYGIYFTHPPYSYSSSSSFSRMILKQKGIATQNQSCIFHLPFFRVIIIRVTSSLYILFSVITTIFVDEK